MNDSSPSISIGLQTLREHLHECSNLHAIVDQLEQHLASLNNNEATLHEQIQRTQMLIAEWEEFFLRSPNMLCVSDLDGYFRKINPALAQTLGYRISDLINRKFIDFVHEDDRAVTLLELQKLGKGHDTINFENRYRCRDGRYRWFNWTCPSAMQRSDLIYSVVRDITDAKRNHEEILFLAQHDSLTGLRNRASFMQELHSACERAKRSPHYDVTVLFIDLDAFKAINDTFGHSAGDLVISSVASRLREASRSCDVVSRMGGDEFTILLQGPDTPALESLIRRLHFAITRPIKLNRRTAVTASASIGTARWRESNASSANELLDAADRAMYGNKARQRRIRESNGMHAMPAPPRTP